MTVNRRVVLGGFAAALSAPMVARAQARPRVVVVGGGAGGATVARRIARGSQGEVDVTLIEPARVYHTCFFSNLHIGGLREFETLAHGYDALARVHGITIIHDWAVGVDREAKTVALAGGGAIPYDRLVLAPGIDFREGAVEGWELSWQEVMPHAYKAGRQTQVLKAQLEAMPEGGTFCIVAPPNPYRCPPAPYERASMVAHVLVQTNPTARILILDPKESFAKQELFEAAWAFHFPGMIERLGPEAGGDKVEVRPEEMEVVIDERVVKVDVCNVIPPQKAGRIAEQAGLIDASGWVPVDPFTLRTQADADIHVLGDAASAGDMPKSAFAANSQGHVVADLIRAELSGGEAAEPRYSNICWSLVAAEDGVKVGASYAPTEDKIARTDGFVSEVGEDARTRRATYEESLLWYDGIVEDMFS